MLQTVILLLTVFLFMIPFLKDKALKEELHFQDIPHSEDTGKTQTHTFTNFPHSADSEDDAGDKTELLNDEKKVPSFWTFEYYQQFFDVNTRQVLFRILGSMTPFPGRNYLTTHIRPNPDLYGPFWICTTLVFTTAIAGNLANYMQSAGSEYTWKYDFHKVTFAATAIFGYWWLVPAALFSVLWWRGSQARYTFLELISLYGYSLAIYIPISILWTIQINWLQWTLVIIGAALSGTVLVFTFWPAVREDSKRIAIIVITVIVIFHTALAAGFVLYFFHVPSPMAPASNITVMTTTTPLLAKQPKDMTGKQLSLSLPDSKHGGHPSEGNASTSGLKLKMPPPVGSKLKTKLSDNVSNSRPADSDILKGTKRKDVNKRSEVISRDRFGRFRNSAKNV